MCDSFEFVFTQKQYERAGSLMVFKSYVELQDARARNPEHFKDFRYFEREYTKTGAHRFEAWKLDAFLEYLQYHDKTRPYHETIEPDDHIAGYFDVEVKNDPTMTLQEWNTLMDELDFWVSQVVGEELKGRRWHAHREGHFSTHVIYPDAWFETALDWTGAAFTIREKMTNPRLQKCLDMKVYVQQPNTKKSLRVPYGCKNSANIAERYPLLPENEPIQFNPQLFCQSLLRCHQRLEVNQKCNAFLPVPVPPFRTFDHLEICLQQYSDNVDQILSREQDEQVQRWFVEMMGLTPNKLKGKPNTWLIVPGLFCPNKKGAHETNKTYFKILNTREGMFTCPKCNLSWECDVDLSYIMASKQGEDFGGLCDLVDLYCKVSQII